MIAWPSAAELNWWAFVVAVAVTVWFFVSVRQK